MTKIEVQKAKDVLIPMDNTNLANPGLEKQLAPNAKNEWDSNPNASKWLIFNTIAVLMSIVIWFISLEETSKSQNQPTFPNKKISDVLRTIVLGCIIGSISIDYNLYACKHPNHLLSYIILFGAILFIDGYEHLRVELLEIGHIMFFAGGAVEIGLSWTGAYAANFKKTPESRYRATIGAVIGSIIGIVVFGLVSRAVLIHRMENHPAHLYPIESIHAIPTSMP
ncbi:hypothetical protein GCK72_008661 [Caenorhabditis remanei]|uniref:Uncharacterized protein n=1 Tax=Caenorhabditis remanei TaxID=31234 RepID=A0A6A5H1R3_CAERE|nr:hypothetical protein GCK72_008661 [Caenorhabditis remanei]KAF1760412.1 hypothetical protein GCK72_008661 [Caenorhabditis remanei]